MAIEKIIKEKINGNNIYELVGPKIISYKDFYNHISNCMNKTRVLTPVPLSVIKPVISITEKTPFSPLTAEQLVLFEKDNISQNIDKSFKDLAINPQDTLQITRNIIEN